MSGQASGPLASVRVLDLTSVLMGPYATQIFADLGADVVKIESPEGDTTRRLPPVLAPGQGAMFLNINRGKRSVAIDLKTPAGRDIVLRLAATADVFIHSMRGAAIERLGLGYAALKAANPKIIYANLYGFGRGGPYADFPAYDDIVQGASGLASLQGRLTGGDPAYVASAVADKVAGLTGTYAVMAALFARERSGRGQEIEVPMFETMTAFVMAEHLCGAVTEPPSGPAEYARVTAPDRRPYRTRDGHIGLMIYNDKQWRSFFKLIGDPDWSRDPMFASMTSRTENIGTVLGRLGDVIVTRTTDEWMEAFRVAEIPAMPIFSTSDLLNDPHLAATGFWHRADSDLGPVRMPGIPTRFSDTPGAIGDIGPALGAHNHAVLAEIGFTPGEIEALEVSGVLRAAAG
ncbi:CaiB/BaiF CoA-transferase family protein [Sphingomonas sp. 28-63-12]|uniref:CaiB/BaiF CoA transferase family protein n=1 Tax=Sphingomonas sp. 28-63-12 TaxID=1970434 RepID=UPI000BD3B861|nr:MAG: CoA transferase [Sphingomonas sp. 28-63-12]